MFRQTLSVMLSPLLQPRTDPTWYGAPFFPEKGEKKLIFFWRSGNLSEKGVSKKL